MNTCNKFMTATDVKQFVLIFKAVIVEFKTGLSIHIAVTHG